MLPLLASLMLQPTPDVRSPAYVFAHMQVHAALDAAAVEVRAVTSCGDDTDCASREAALTFTVGEGY